MRFIPTAVHGVVDYIVGSIVIALPFLFGWADAARATFIVLGIAVIAYSALTDYELGLVRYLRIRFHLMLDAVFGTAMLIAPLVLSIPSSQRTPVYALGVAAIFLVAVTKVRAEGSHSN